MEHPAKHSSEYIRSVVAMKTRKEDPREVVITDKIRAYVSETEWSRSAFARTNTLLLSYMKDAIAHASDHQRVHDATQEVLREAAKLLNTKIVEGEELLATIPKGSPVLVATNHFGGYKLWGIDPKKDLGVDIEGYNYMAPFPGYFAPLKPVADAIGDTLYYSSNEFPGVLGTIHENAGFIHLPPVMEGGRTEYLAEQTREKITQHPHSAFVIFPEGTTSGKPSGGGPFDLNQFKTGAYVIAAQLGIRIVPVAQFFDPEHGFQLKVFEPFVPTTTDRAGYEAYAKRDQDSMQQWFDKKLGR